MILFDIALFVYLILVMIYIVLKYLESLAIFKKKNFCLNENKMVTVINIGIRIDKGEEKLFVISSFA